MFGAHPSWLRRTVRAALLAVLAGGGGLYSGCSSFTSGNEPPTGDPHAWPGRLPALREDVRRRPQDLDLQARLALAYFFSDSFALADSVAGGVLARQPRQALALYVRALMHERQGDWGSADSVYRQGDELTATTPELKRIMRSRHGIASREILKAEVRKEEPSAPVYNTLLVQGFAPLAAAHSDSVLAAGVTHFLTTTLAQIESLNVVDYSRRQLLEEEIFRSAAASPLPLRLLPTFCGAALSIAGRAGIPDPEAAAVWVQYDLADAATDPDDPDYRGTQSPRELSPPTRYLLSDLGSEVVWIVEKCLHLELSPELRERLARVPTRDFEAFMAFAEGLIWEQKSEFGKAHAFFREAERLDPDFPWAREAAERTVGIGERGEPLPPRMAPATTFNEELVEQASAVAATGVDQMPAERAEAPPGTSEAAVANAKTLIVIDPRIR